MTPTITKGTKLMVTLQSGSTYHGVAVTDEDSGHVTVALTSFDALILGELSPIVYVATSSVAVEA